jgi:hypothetical protein
MWSAEIAVGLRELGHDVVAVVERADLLSKSDAFLLAFARSEERVFVTENRKDFRVLAQRIAHNHSGLVFTIHRRFPRERGGTVRRVVTALDQLARENTPLAGLEHWLNIPDEV